MASDRGEADVWIGEATVEVRPRGGKNAGAADQRRGPS